MATVSCLEWRGDEGVGLAVEASDSHRLYTLYPTKPHVAANQVYIIALCYPHSFNLSIYPRMFIRLREKSDIEATRVITRTVYTLHPLRPPDETHLLISVALYPRGVSRHQELPPRGRMEHEVLENPRGSWASACKCGDVLKL